MSSETTIPTTARAEARRSPAPMAGMAAGRTTRRKIVASPAPKARAISTSLGGVSRTPAAVLRTSRGRAKATIVATRAASPMPKAMTKTGTSGEAGTASRKPR